MDLLSGKEAAARIQGIILEKFQVHGHSVDLTACKIYSVDPAGKVDFSGSEYAAAELTAVGTIRHHPEDRYEWWDLERGSFYIEFNETLELAENEIAMLEPLDRLIRAGASHASVFLRGRAAPLHTLLNVDALNLCLKQNARISRLSVFRLVPEGKSVKASGAARVHAPAKPARKKSKKK